MRNRLWFGCTFVLAFAVTTLLQERLFPPTPDTHALQHLETAHQPRGLTHEYQPVRHTPLLKQMRLHAGKDLRFNRVGQL